MSKKSSIGFDTIKLSGSKIITTLIALVSSMLLSRFRSLTEYGTYSQLLMIVNLICSFIMLGLPNSINYFLAKAKDEDERSRFLSVYYTLNTILSFVVGAVLVLAIPLLEIYFDNPLVRTFWYFLAFFPWTKIIMSSIGNLLIVYHKATMLFFYNIANSALLLGIIVLVQVCKWTFSVYMILYLVTEAVFTLIVYFFARSSSPNLRFSLDWSLIKTIFAFSIPLGIASMIGTVSVELDKLVITSFFSTEDLAIYSNASKELPVNIIASSLTAVLLPQMVRLLHSGKKSNAVSLWGSATTISFAIISFVSAACIAFAPEVITVLYSEKFLPGVDVFRIYSFALLLKCTYFGMILNSYGKTKLIMFSSIAVLVINMLLNYLFYMMWGFVGPAIATFISSLSMSIFQLIFTSKYIQIPFKNIFPWKSCGLLLLANAVGAIAFYFIQLILKQFIPAVPAAIGLGIVWLCLYTLVILKPIKKQWAILNRKEDNKENNPEKIE